MSCGGHSKCSKDTVIGFVHVCSADQINSTENATSTSIAIPLVALIELPQELFKLEDSKGKTSNRLLYSYYTATSLFPVRNVNDTTNLTLGSFILGALVAGINVTDLTENVNITLILSEVCHKTLVIACMLCTMKSVSLVWILLHAWLHGE